MERLRDIGFEVVSDNYYLWKREETEITHLIHIFKHKKNYEVNFSGQLVSNDAFLYNKTFFYNDIDEIVRNIINFLEKLEVIYE